MIVGFIDGDFQVFGNWVFSELLFPFVDVYELLSTSNHTGRSFVRGRNVKYLRADQKRDECGGSVGINRCPYRSTR